jgi:hypothetical protein
VLQQIVEGCGDEFAPYMTPELRSVIFRALLHRNRFVRETCYYTLAALCALCSHAQLLEFASDVAERLQDGLNENWSQVGLVFMQATLSRGSQARTPADA